MNLEHRLLIDFCRLEEAHRLGELQNLVWMPRKYHMANPPIHEEYLSSSALLSAMRYNHLSHIPAAGCSRFVPREGGGSASRDSRLARRWCEPRLALCTLFVVKKQVVLLFICCLSHCLCCLDPTFARARLSNIRGVGAQNRPNRRLPSRVALPLKSHF